IGESSVGKSSIILRFASNEFQENKEPTVGAAFVTQKCRLEDKIIKFEIWDTAGQERFHSLAQMYYRNAHVAVVVYDVTNMDSFNRAKSWIKELNNQANPNIIIALLGNKIDLSRRQVSTEIAKNYALEFGLLFYEISARKDHGIREAFTKIGTNSLFANLILKREKINIFLNLF
ncbi:small GTPase superfamily, partial [Rhizophagus diaphanus]